MTTHASNTFVPGQRWVSDTESELGLGTVLADNGRQVTLVFMNSGETRIYATESATLTRAQFSPGDRIESHEGWFLTVTAVSAEDGLLSYTGKRDDGSSTTLHETALSSFIRLNKPSDRLLSGQLDDDRWFALRTATFSHAKHLSHSPLFGLQGARIDLLSHQLYIAREVGARLAPRVLLADEVGLGKTIEAGLILHYQYLHEQIQRVLVLVPDALLHQWLVEMLRRFNLVFHIMDAEKYRAITDQGEDINPFSQAQLVLCSQDFLTQSDDALDAAVSAGWDMLVVDEAHHLGWQEHQPSPEYQAVEALANTIASVLLLTATPEQLGQAGHFARLRLLDPDRFSSLPTFLEERTHYREIAALASALDGDTPLMSDDVNALQPLLDASLLPPATATALCTDSADATRALRQSLLDHLIDRHGTGRVLFRNTRSAIKGFAEREVHHVTLPSESPEQVALCDWLNDFVRGQYPAKSLMICRDAETVLDIAEQLRVRFGVHVAVFHEKMRIVERDRAAAWFANPEDDCLLMICSEIGGEGRNFQFLYNLILYQLPDDPDLVEQRIGRLDRIGQRHKIHIYLPSQADARDARLARWYDEGLNALRHTAIASGAVARALADPLAAMLDASPLQTATLDTLIAEGQALSHEKEADLERGRDRLLELHSHRPDRIAALLDDLKAADQARELSRYLLAVFDAFGVDVDEQSDGTWIVRPGSHMRVASFPGIPDEGMTVTFDRGTALAREDLVFLTWDHPLVAGAMDFITAGTHGQASIAMVDLPELPQAALYLDTLFRVEHTVSSDATLRRYLPADSLRFVLDEAGEDADALRAAIDLDAAQHSAEAAQARPFMRAKAEVIRPLIDTAVTRAQTHLPALVAESHDQIVSEYDAEIARLRQLQQHNPLIRDSEIEALTARRDGLLAGLDGVTINLVAVRVLVNVRAPV